MMAVYNQHLLLSGTPVLKYKERRWQHSPMADTPRSNASSTYDLEDSFLAAGGYVIALQLTVCRLQTLIYLFRISCCGSVVSFFGKMCGCCQSDCASYAHLILSSIAGCLMTCT